MRITFFVPKCTPDNSHGRYVVEIAKRLGREHEIAIYSAAFSPPLRSIARCHFLPIPLRPAIARLLTLWTASSVEAKRRPADIIHVQGADAPVGTVLTAHFCNQAMLSTLSRTIPLRLRINYRIGAVAEKYCMSKSSTRRVIAVSEKVKEDVVRHYKVDPQKIVVIHNGVDCDNFHPRNRNRAVASARTDLNLSQDAFIVAFVGGDYRRKGLVPLLRAAARVGGKTVVLAVGVSPDGALTHLVRREGLLKHVRFLEHSPDIGPLYAMADCFVLPTVYDTFSLAALEAMASGLPVIVSRSAGITEILTPNQDSIVLDDPGDVALLASHLEQLSEDGDLRARLSAEARRTAERHSWDAVAARTRTLYEESLRVSR